VHHAVGQAGTCLFDNIEGGMKLDPRLCELPVDARKARIRANALLAQRLVRTELVRM